MTGSKIISNCENVNIIFTSIPKVGASISETTVYKDEYTEMGGMTD